MSKTDHWGFFRAGGSTCSIRICSNTGQERVAVAMPSHIRNNEYIDHERMTLASWG